MASWFGCGLWNSLSSYPGSAFYQLLKKSLSPLILAFLISKWAEHLVWLTQCHSWHLSAIPTQVKELMTCLPDSCTARAGHTVPFWPVRQNRTVWWKSLGKQFCFLIKGIMAAVSPLSLVFLLSTPRRRLKLWQPSWNLRERPRAS